MEEILLKATILLLAGLFIFSPVFHGNWIMDDDRIEVADNPVIHAPDGVWKLWRGEGSADYLPLKSTVMWVMWRVFGADTTGYHLMSLAFHLASALLLWRIFWRLGIRHAWIGGLLFVAHPIFVESVAWISEIKNTLSMLVLLPMVLVWLNFEENRKRRDYAGALLLFIATLLCKASSIMWPVVILLYAWWKRGRIDRRDLWASVPFFVISLATAVTTIWLQKDRAIMTEVFPLGGILSRTALAGLDTAFYLGNILYPVGLIPLYPQWPVNPPSAAEFLPWPILAAVMGWLWTKRGTNWGRHTLFGMGFFLINLVPVMGFFTMSFMRLSWASDHLAYLPALGIIGLIAAGLSAGYDHLNGWKRPLAAGAGWILLGLLIFNSYRYAGAFADIGAYCRYTLSFNPDAWAAHLYSANLAYERNDADALFEHASAAVRLKPDVAETQNVIGNALVVKRDMLGAIIHYREAIRLTPNSVPIRMNYANTLVGANRFAEALEQYRAVLAYSPNNPVAHCNIGACYFRGGQLGPAIAEFREALRLAPNMKDAQTNLDLALRQQSGTPETPPAPAP